MDISAVETTEQYIFGGIDSIATFIARYYSYNDIQSIKKQFIKQDLIILKKFKEFKSSAIGHILSEIAKSHNIPPLDYWVTFEYIPFTTYYNSDLKTCCVNFIEQADIEDEEKIKMINSIESFAIDLYATELLRDVFEYNLEAETALFTYVPDITVALELRLEMLNKHINLTNKAIIKNKEILRNSRKPHIKLCATILNQFLEAYLKRIYIDLEYYIKQLQTSFNDILDTKTAKVEMLNSLFENQQKLDIYLSYEKILMQKGYIDPENNSWLQSPILFIKFYQYCEIKGLFKMIFKGKTKGISRLRELYSFQEGKSLDKPSKRHSIPVKTITTDYFFLNI
ncbi:hypothetical protein ACX0HA_01485 [Flavobacterium hauense]